MARVVLNGVSEELLGSLRREAARHKRGLTSEVLHRLERSLAGSEEARDWLQRVRALRESVNVSTTTAEIIAARDSGRR